MHSGFIKFFLNIGACITFIRNFICNTIFIFLIFLIILGLLLTKVTSSDSDKSMEAKELLVINFKDAILDAPINLSNAEELVALIKNDKKNESPYLKQYIDAINHAALDENVKAIYMDLTKLNAIRPDMLSNLDKPLKDFKAKGKKIFVFSESYTQSIYALASYADEIYLDPVGEITIPGYSMGSIYFKDFIDLINLTVYTPKVGTHKSAVEPFNRNDMSPWVKEEYTILNNDLWDSYLKLIKQNRPKVNISSLLFASDSYLNLLTKYEGNDAQLALKEGLVDKLATRLEAMTDVSKQLNIKLKTVENNKVLDGTSINEYIANLKTQNADENVTDSIAIIYGIGEMKSQTKTMQDFTNQNIISQIREANNNKNIKAVVLYLNTPGGEVYTAEMIRRELEILKANNKKVVVFMSNMTASGGYYIASAADWIIATPTTITGSIGVYGMDFSAYKIANNFGIYADGITNNPNHTNSLIREKSENSVKAIQLKIESVYKLFLGFVAKGRNMSMEQANEIAQGKIYTGNQALKIHLVDELGTFEDAINKAAELSKISKYNIKTLKPQEVDEELSLMASLTGKVLMKIDDNLALSFINQVTQKAPLPIKDALTNDNKKHDYIYSINPIEIDYK